MQNDACDKYLLIDYRPTKLKKKHFYKLILSCTLVPLMALLQVLESSSTLWKFCSSYLFIQVVQFSCYNKMRNRTTNALTSMFLFIY